MAEATQYVFTHKELVEVLIKKAGVHEGLWQLLVNFGLGAANTGPNSNEMLPTALIPVLSVGIQRVTEKTNLCVDAAEVNPP